MKVYPYVGIVGTTLPYFLIAVAIELSPWFNWFNNALSDLGNTALALNVSSGAAWVFDGGLISSGILTLLFSLLFMKAKGYSWEYLIWGIPLALASIDLAAIGIFNESFGMIHLVVSVIFFFLIDLTLFLYSYVSFPMKTHKTGALALFLGVFSTAIWVARWPWSGVAIPEAATSVAGAILVLWISVVALRKSAL